MGSRLIVPRDAITEYQPNRVVFDAVSSLLPVIRGADRSPSYQAAMTATPRASRIVRCPRSNLDSSNEHGAVGPSGLEPGTNGL